MLAYSIVLPIEHFFLIYVFFEQLWLTQHFMFFSFVKIPVLTVLPEAGGDSQGSDGALAPVKPEV